MTNRSKLSKLRSFGSLLEFLLMTSAIALSAGIGFGAAIRFGQPEALSGQNSNLPKEQSFPPREDWPGSQEPSDKTR